MRRPLIPLLATIVFAIAAAPAAATEGPPPGGTPLPDTLAPVGIPKTPAGVIRRPRVMAARVTPRRVRHGHRSRLRVALATPGSVRVTIERRVRGHLRRVTVRIVAAPAAARVIRLPARLRPGRYRVTVVAIDAQGTRSQPAHRMLVVARH